MARQRNAGQPRQSARPVPDCASLHPGYGAIWLIFALWAALAPATAQSPQPVDAPRRLAIKAEPITAFDTRDPSRRRFGALTFRGGLELTSPDKAFGGLSGIHIASDGRAFIAATDRGDWLRGEIRYDGAKPVGMINAEMAPMLGSDGRPLAKRDWFDTESIAADGGTLYAGIERVNRIVRFDYGKGGPSARATVMKVPPAIARLPNNRGIEGLIYVPRKRPLAGTLIVFAERSLDAAGNHTAFLIGGPRPGRFALKRHRDFDITDAALLPAGDVLVVERRYTPMTGVGLRLRRIAQAEIKPGALVDGELLLLADMGHQIDNMEALAVHRSGADTVVTMVSDDNFSPLQRTLLLQFTLVE